MFLDPYYQSHGETVQITANQGSRFAKGIAADYNPIHDAGSRRFCVPGDLLFALVLARYGLSARMSFHFRGMLGADVPVRFPASAGEIFDIVDENGKVFLHVERDGAQTHEPERIEAFVRRYVSFSGRNFPHYLLPLMAERGVMFNPDRPLVIYDSMGFALETAALEDPDMTFTGSGMDVQGKRAEARLDFGIDDGGRRVGAGTKKLIVSGLRPYDDAVMDAFVADFEARIPQG